MSKVSASIHLHSIDICRSKFDMATLTAGSIDPMETFGDIWRWLRGAHGSVVSHLVFLHRFVVDILNLDLYRCNLNPTTSPLPSNESNDSVRTF